MPGFLPGPWRFIVLYTLAQRVHEIDDLGGLAYTLVARYWGVLDLRFHHLAQRGFVFVFESCRRKLRGFPLDEFLASES